MADNQWADCKFLTCSVLPVRVACNLTCPFCFSKSSISSLKHDRLDWSRVDVDGYFQFAKEKGATRLVITGGGEPLLKPDDVVHLVGRGKKWFDEIACFTNGARLTKELATRLQEAGLSYLCWSRHEAEDVNNRELMGQGAPLREEFFQAAHGLKVRATCVMAQGHVDSQEKVWNYVRQMSTFGVSEFTFKHTYVAYPQSVFADSQENQWARQRQVEFDPFAGQGRVLARLPWGPEVRRVGEFQVCYYFEPTPSWEREQQLCRSSNLLSDGAVYASLEDQRSLLYRLPL